MRSEVPSDRNPLLFRDLLNGFFTVSRYEVLCGLVKGTVPLFLYWMHRCQICPPRFSTMNKWVASPFFSEFTNTASGQQLGRRGR